MKTGTALAIALVALVAFGTVSQAHQAKVADLVVDHPWARATLGNVPNGAAYMEITNNGTESDRLLGATSENADRVELHTHDMDGEVMRMRKVENGISIPAGETVAFEPGGLHVMMFGLKEKLVAGQATYITLEFEKSGDVDIMVMISKSAPKKQNQPSAHTGHQ